VLGSASPFPDDLYYYLVAGEVTSISLSKPLLYFFNLHIVKLPIVC
jgi:hypothetical protein